MKKIPTIFDRNWEGDHKVIDKLVVDPETFLLSVATEKLDGTNIRVTVRNHTAVRVEKRCNPTNIQKQKGIVDPWYAEAFETDPQDKYIFAAVKGTDFSDVPDGEWNGEALGENIQGNPLKLTGNTVFFFTLNRIVFEDCPTTYDELKEWLPKQKSKFGNDCGIEGIVWHSPVGMCKIKTKDF